MYADYQFYTDSFYGTVIQEADFPHFSSKASDFLDYYTMGKAAAATDESAQTALAKACCAVAEQMLIDENARKIAMKAQASAVESGEPEKKSETVGGWSATYATVSDYMGQSTAEAKNAQRTVYANIAAEYLLNTGLLYRGGCKCTHLTP